MRRSPVSTSSPSRESHHRSTTTTDPWGMPAYAHGTPLVSANAHPQRRWPQAPRPASTASLLVASPKRDYVPSKRLGHISGSRMVTAGGSEPRHACGRRRAFGMQWPRAAREGGEHTRTGAATLGQGCLGTRRRRPRLRLVIRRRPVLRLSATMSVLQAVYDIVVMNMVASANPHPHIPSHHLGHESRLASPPRRVHSPLRPELRVQLDDDGRSAVSSVRAGLVDFGIGEVRNGDVFAGNGPTERRRLERRRITILATSKSRRTHWQSGTSIFLGPAGVKTPTRPFQFLPRTCHSHRRPRYRPTTRARASRRSR
ncbi:hypothetical protein HMN09_01406500 [Mycena chlorophos]|uniref:Uncharacterized protein n=1 Tax=Mycena chlorophos TaxID=658473 RepID=A0A8H6RUZ1_MYCCL|nr:hypothetical protein HMN09_01406500 [Mycena chlorophos]